MTPSVWNGGVFSMIRNLYETVIISIASIILTFIMCYELIQMVIEKNNLHDFETFMFFKWIFKIFVAVMIITNTFDIIMGIFDLSQHVVSGAAGVIISDTNTAIADMETRLLATKYVCWIYHECPYHLYFCSHLWTNGRDIFNPLHPFPFLQWQIGSGAVWDKTI